MLRVLADNGGSGPSAVIDEVLPKLLGPATRASQPQIVARVRELALSSPAEAFAGGIRALMTRPDSTPLLRTIHCPTLIVVGADDVLTPPAFSEELHHGIAGSELTVIPGAGHLSSIEQSAAFSSAPRGISDPSGIVGGIMLFASSRLKLGYGVCALAVVVLAALPAAQSASLGPFDFVLDTYVRDGYVYYRALKSDRRRLDEYVNTLATADVDKRANNEQIAFWLNAYDALVLRTVIDHYPIPRRSTDYPAGSVRQIPGSFERLTHRVAGRTLTSIKSSRPSCRNTTIPACACSQPRLGGRGRLRSSLRQRTRGAARRGRHECVTRAECIQIDNGTNTLNASSILSWHEKEFVANYADKADPVYAMRSPIERAILAFVRPKLLQTERDFLEKNTFRLAYRPFDWSLNDLTGRGDTRQ